MTQFWFAASTEEFRPSQMLEQVKAAEQAGFDAIGCSDHFAPWWPEGAASSAWAFLPAAGQVTGTPLFTAVTPVQHHYHPAAVAQYWMSLAELYPGRAILGAGSGEALNEVPTGLVDWPSPDEKLGRFDKALEAIRRLWDGETVTMDGGWFRLQDAKLYTRAETPPRMIVSAFGPKAARIAGRWGDGLWTMGDPEIARPVIEAYRASCQEHGREPGEIVAQAGFHLGEPEDELIARARKWKSTQMPEVYLHDLHDPAEMTAEAHERMSDEEFAHEGFLVASDPHEHIDRIGEIIAIDGVTTVCLQLIGDLDPLGAVRRYGEEVLPALRRARATA
jgi:coenzyme F420-dependent glucose-6-phosphate dehydrogenase